MRVITLNANVQAVVLYDGPLDNLAAIEANWKRLAGMTIPEAAAALGISVASAERWWAFARTWLYAELADTGEEKTPPE